MALSLRKEKKSREAIDTETGRQIPAEVINFVKQINVIICYTRDQ